MPEYLIIQQGNSRKLLSKQPHINHMVKTGEEVIIKGLQDLFANVQAKYKISQQGGAKPAGDKALRDEMRQLTASIRSMQSRAMADSQHRRVRENIERRAELRDKTSIRMPNIARLLTGGAESPMAGLGRIQGAISKPFKNVWNNLVNLKIKTRFVFFF